MTRHGTPPATPGLSPACFTHLSPLLVFGEPVCLMGSLTLAYSSFALAAAFRAGLFSFLSAKLSPVWPKPPPDRAGTGRSPTWGGNRPKRASWGRIWALRGFVGRLTVGGPPVPEGTQGTQNSARGGDGIGVTCQGFPKGARRQCVPVYSSAYTQYVGDLIFPNTR